MLYKVDVLFIWCPDENMYKDSREWSSCHLVWHWTLGLEQGQTTPGQVTTNFKWQDASLLHRVEVIFSGCIKTACAWCIQILIECFTVFQDILLGMFKTIYFDNVLFVKVIGLFIVWFLCWTHGQWLCWYIVINIQYCSICTPNLLCLYYNHLYSVQFHRTCSCTYILQTHVHCYISFLWSLLSVTGF